MVMSQSVHLRSARVRTQGACGAGYTWPSSIALTDNTEHVTCRACLDIIVVREDQSKFEYNSITREESKLRYGEVEPEVTP